MATPTIRFRIEPISQLGTGVHRIQVDCWRFTVNLCDQDSSDSFDGALFRGNMIANRANDQFWPWRFTVGGVILPDGRPVMLDQVITLNIANQTAGGVLVYEYLDLAPNA